MIIISSLNGPPSSAGWLVLVLPKKTSITARLRCRRSIIVIVVFWASSYSLVVVFYSSPSCRSGSATKDNCIVFPKSTTTNQSRAEQGRLQWSHPNPFAVHCCSQHFRLEWNKVARWACTHCLVGTRRRISLADPLFVIIRSPCSSSSSLMGPRHNTSSTKNGIK